MFHSSWKTFKTRFGPIINNLKRHRNLISDEKLTIAVKEVRGLPESIEEKLETLSRQMKELRLEEKEEEIMKLHERRIHRLQFVLNKFDIADSHIDRELEHARRERRHHSASGKWIFDNPLFSEWADLKFTRNNTLYL